jgi:hypothetical protein
MVGKEFTNPLGLFHADGSLDPDRKQPPLPAASKMDSPAVQELEMNVESTLLQRRAQYGETPFTQETDAEIWHGLLQRHFQIKLPPLSPYMVPLMMTAIKIARAAGPFPLNEDDYVDGIGYLTIARKCRDK